MLASLLPGLRGVRTPLSVGYLWLLFGSLIWAEWFHETSFLDDATIARVFTFGGFLGKGAVVAAVSFLAYVLGAMLTIPVRGRVAESFFGRIPEFLLLPKLLSHFEAMQIRTEYDAFLRGIEKRFWRAVDRVSDSELDSARRASSDLLGLRLSAAGENELYGEYDRYAAEGSFRANVSCR